MIKQKTKFYNRSEDTYDVTFNNSNLLTLILIQQTFTSFDIIVLLIQVVTFILTLVRVSNDWNLIFLDPKEAKRSHSKYI